MLRTGINVRSCSKSARGRTRSSRWSPPGRRPRFGGSQQALLAHEPTALLKGGRFPRLGGWFQVGADDQQPYQAIQQLVPLARAAGIATCSVVMPGEGHTFDVWSDAFRQALPFFAKRLRLPPEPAENPEPCRD